jgi:hypothetical protein
MTGGTPVCTATSDLTTIILIVDEPRVAYYNGIHDGK